MAAIASIDFETASVVDLRKSGASRYARDPDTYPMCMAWANGQQDAPQLWLPGDPIPPPLLDLVHQGGTLCAWNAAFERLIWREIMTPRFGWPAVPDDQWSCSMATAMYWGLPASLEMAAPALGLGARAQKDANGKALMRLFMQPTHYDEHGRPVWAMDDPRNAQKLIDYYAYCLQDVVTEQAVKARLPTLPARERDIWLLDAEMNDRGITVDMDLVQRMHALARHAREQLNTRIATLTNGRVATTRARADFLRWVQSNMDVLDLIDRPSLLDSSHARWRADSARREVLLDLRKLVPDHVGEVIDVWLDGARTSPAKLDALLRATDSDNQLRGTLRYYGAGRTGRWSGAGGTRAQLQNLPRPTIKQVDGTLELIEHGADVDAIELLCEDSTLAVIASCLRGCFTAPPGQLLVCADLAQIEARMIAWLAGQHDVLEVFAKGEDIYQYTAASVGSDNRHLGKIIRLALAYGMGPNKFVSTAHNWGVDIDIQQAVRIVHGFREASPDIVQFWWDLDRALRRCLKRDPYDPLNADWLDHVGSISMRQMRNGGLAVRLPSGRYLIYRDCHVQPRKLYDDAGKEIGEDPERTEIVYAGVHPKTHKWTDIRTYGGKLAENITQAAARDVMAEAMLILHKRGHTLLLTCHDEIISSAAAADAYDALEDMLMVMRRPVTWAPGLPIDATGFCARRYRK